MNRIIPVLAALLSVAAFVSLPATVYGRESSSVDSISITAVLSTDGNAEVTEVWDVEIYEGTEWYLVRRNLGDIAISGLKVSGDGRPFENVGRWDVNRSIEEKAFKCGTVTKEDGCELCWGLGSYGKHTFTVTYTMTNAVKSLNDYDALHLQFVSPGIRPRPQKIRVAVKAGTQPLDETNAAVWSFGYDGTVNFVDGGIVAETLSPFVSDRYSMILLARFNKGLFNSGSVRDMDFAELQSRAFEGSDYQGYLDSQNDEDFPWQPIAAVGFIVAASVWLKSRLTRRRNLRIFGVHPLKDIGYFRDIPFNGNVLEANSILTQSGSQESAGHIASALILRLLQSQYITLSNNGRRKVDIGLDGPVKPDSLEGPSLELYRLLEYAAGPDRVLQEKEFPHWAARHREKIQSFLDSVEDRGSKDLKADGYSKGGSFLPSGQEQARNLLGFRKFLKDFTLVEERKSVEVVLWQDYLVFAALFGIADKVAAELKEINPQAFREVTGYDVPTLSRAIYLSDHYGTSMVRSISRQTAGSVAGHGGFSSFGGGGGFSGGGFGGGAR